MSAISDAVTGLALRYPHLTALAITRICRKAWPRLQRFEVVEMLTKAGIERGGADHTDTYTRANIQADHAAGLSDAEIAAKYGKTVGDVRYDGGLRSVAPAQATRDKDDEEAVEMPEGRTKVALEKRIAPVEVMRLRAAGLGWSEIARQLGTGCSSLYPYMKRQGLPRDISLAKAWLVERGEAMHGQADSEASSSGTEPAGTHTATPDSTTVSAVETPTPPAETTTAYKPDPPEVLDEAARERLMAAMGFRPFGQVQPCNPPLLTIKRAGIDAEEAKRRYLPLIHAALFDGGKVDIDICIREVQA